MQSRNPNLTESRVTRGVWVCLIFSLLFCGYFFCQQLPNNPDFSRLDIWGLVLDELLLTPSDLFGSDNDSAGISLPQALTQRAPMVSSAAILLLSAWILGSLTQQLLCPAFNFLWSERLAIRFGTGLSWLSLITLIAGLAGQLSSWVIVVPTSVSAVVLLAVTMRSKSARPPENNQPDSTIVYPEERLPGWGAILCIVLLAIYLPYLLLGSLSPPTDFDVREYHLQGPKEWFQAGHIHYLRHNVYTSFPFLTEMLSLAGMVLQQDWWTGALTGKLVLACFAPLTTLCVYSIARRYAGLTPAVLAVIIHLTTPWTLRISLIAYAEGALTFYLTATTMLSLLLINRKHTNQLSSGFACLLGLLAGSAMACKYTGLVSVIVPASVITLAASIRSYPAMKSAGSMTKALSRFTCLRIVGLFVAGICLTVGPWLARNLADTGNPVFPLGYSVFGGSEWNPEINERWKTAHGAPEHQISRIPQHLLDAAVRNDWTSPLLFAFMLPSITMAFRNRQLQILWLIIAWQFITWWALTHRIDRFWIPTIPLLAVTAAWTWQRSASRVWHRGLILVIAVCTLFNLRFCLLPLIGFHAGLTDITVARQIPVRSDFRELNKTLTTENKVLMVGEAEVFDATFPVVYNTVFDDSVFEEWSSGNPPVSKSATAAIAHNLAENGITHIMVNWFEILRYRLPGSYGYAEFVQPSRMNQLVASGLLSPPQVLLARPIDGFSEQELSILKSLEEGDSLINPSGQITGGLLYKVLKDSTKVP